MAKVCGADCNVHSSSTSRHSKWGVSSKHDVVQHDNGSDFIAGEVKAHMAVDGFPVTLLNIHGSSSPLELKAGMLSGTLDALPWA